MSLLARLCLLVALAVLPALALQVLDQVELREVRQSAATGSALRLARLAAGQAERILASARSVLVTVGRLPFVVHEDRATCAAFLADLVTQYSYFSEIAVLDRTGATICASLPYQADAGFRDSTLLRGALDADDMLIGQYDPGAGTRPATLPVARRFRGADGEPAGIVVVGLDLQHVPDWFGSEAYPDGSIVLIVDRNGTTLMRVPEHGSVGKTVLPDLLTALRGGVPGTIERNVPDGIDRVFGYMPFEQPRAELGVAVGVPKLAAYAALERANERDFALEAAAAILTVLAALFGGRYFIRRPLRALVRTAERWRRGDYSARASLGDPHSEIGQLGDAFDRMADAVQRRDEDLQGVNTLLEQRVAGRTQELSEGNERLRTEISERRQAEAALQDAQAALAQSQKMEAIGRLTGGIAHDFNNYLAAIIGAIELLQQRLRLEAADARLLTAARTSAERGAALTQQLLAFSRRQALAPEVTDLSRLVSAAAELLRRTLGEHIIVETSLAPDLWPCLVDPNQLESALLNLAINARDAMADGGRLTIATRNVTLDAEAAAVLGREMRPGTYILLSMADEGSGMEPEVVARAFEPFYTTKAQGRGTGLGLSQVFGFVNQSGGHIDLDSAPGRGTIVRLYLPRHAALGMAQPSETPSPARCRTSSATVLVVEDDDGVREFSVGALTDLGYRVVAAADADAALDLLDRHGDIDVMFSDIGLPGMNGRDLADEAMRRRPALKVLLTTGYARDTLALGGALDPALPLLPKPFTTAALAAKLDELFGAT
jgi:signal transduction histidine kinase/CheY-like chemotaxis protein